MPKQQSIERVPAGLHTTSNPYTAPEGALLEAENIVVHRDGVASKARGFARYGIELANQPRQLMEYQDTLLVHHGNKIARDSDGAGTWIDYTGTFEAPELGRRIRWEEIRKNFYFLTSNGVFRNDAVTNQPTAAGLPAPFFQKHFVTAAAGGFLANNKTVSYRFTYSRKDATGRLIESAPTDRMIVENTTGGAANVLFLNVAPFGIQEPDTLNVYRTVQVDIGTDPGDRHLLVREIVLSDSLSLVNDIDLADEFLGRDLYTNAQVETISQANEIPPFAKDLTVFQGHTFYANTRQPHEATFKIFDSTEFASAKTLTITRDGITRTVDIGPRNGTLGAESLEIEYLTIELIDDINRSLSENYRAFLIESPELEVPGIRIQAISHREDEFTLSVPSGTEDAFDQPFPLTSTQEVLTNGIYRSKLEQPDAVPRVNFDLVGSERSEIIRILPTRSQLIILTDDEGVFRLTGETEQDFIIDQIDPSIRIKHPDAACVLNNSVYCFSNQGIVRIDESGVALISRPDEFDMDKEKLIANFGAQVFSFPYEAEREYWFCFPEDETADHTQRAKIYNHLTNAWYERIKRLSCGHVLRDTDRLYVGHGRDNFVLEQRRALNEDDYIDEVLDITITQIGEAKNAQGDTVTTLRIISEYVDPPLPGWLITYGSLNARVRAVTAVSGELNTYDVELEAVVGFPPLPSASLSAGFYGLLSALVPGYGLSPNGASSAIGNASGQISIGIPSRMAWVPEAVGNPDRLKFFSYCQISLESTSTTRQRIGFRTDFQGQEDTVIIDLPSEAYGFGTYGETIYGGSTIGATHVRTPIPTEYRRARHIVVSYEHEEALEGFEILNMGLTLRVNQDRTVKVPR